jgi:hypothetical protein
LLKEALEKDPPYGARVEFEVEKSAHRLGRAGHRRLAARNGQRGLAPVLRAASAAMGEGGTIPFMGMLQERFPAAQFVVTGLLGPKSNAHGPNEFLHIPTGKKLTAAWPR